MLHYKVVGSGVPKWVVRVSRDIMFREYSMGEEGGSFWQDDSNLSVDSESCELE
jgi:hypothetical protein